ncbi:MAG: LysE family translocator [Schwartzia sp.]|nr:LysE family translocator [Schwartzia sp. (in: firmicutes)]
METSTLFYFLLTSALLTIAPGPDNMYLLAKSLADGPKSGVALAGGLASGIFVHTTLVLLGVAALIQSSPAALSALKYGGALYLFYLAWFSFRAKNELRLGAADTSKNLFSLYRRGVLMNVLNPKVLLFFLAFLPQFISTENGTAEKQIALLGFLFAVQAFLIFSAVAVCAGRLRRALLRKKGIGRILNIAQGVILLVIALLLLF